MWPIQLHVIAKVRKETYLVPGFGSKVTLNMTNQHSLVLQNFKY